jgi:hypothetical protein
MYFGAWHQLKGDNRRLNETWVHAIAPRFPGCSFDLHKGKWAVADWADEAALHYHDVLSEARLRSSVHSFTGDGRAIDEY